MQNFLNIKPKLPKTWPRSNGVAQKFKKGQTIIRHGDGRIVLILACDADAAAYKIKVLAAPILQNIGQEYFIDSGPTDDENILYFNYNKLWDTLNAS